MAVSFEIKKKKRDGSFRYVRMDDGKRTGSGTATYEKWATDEEKSAWSDAVKAYCKENNIKLPSDEISDEIQKFKDIFDKSDANMKTDSPMLSNIMGVVASLEEDPIKFIDNLVTTCKAGPFQPKDLLMGTMIQMKNEFIDTAKNKASNYKTLMKAYAEPLTQSLETVNNDYLAEYDAAQEEWRKKYADEISSFNIALAEYEPTKYSMNVDNGTTSGSGSSGSSGQSETDNVSEIQPTEDIWSTLSQIPYSDGEIPSVVQEKVVKAMAARYGNNNATKETFNRYNELLGKYFKSAFLQYNVPIQMSLLSIIETNCSMKKGTPENTYTALGIWQFTRDAGSDYGLLTGYWAPGKSTDDKHNFIITSDYDYRLDVEKQSYAAAKYMRTMHDKWCRQWMFTAAGYNWGPGNVQKAIKKYGTNPWELLSHFPDETRNYCLLLIGLSQKFNMSTDFLTQ